jgi:hypothetical protein
MARGGAAFMAISFVNGFLCTCSCDVAKAKLGQDPHPAEHAARLRNERANTEQTRLADVQSRPPSVVWGGSLADVFARDSAPPINPDNAADATPTAVPGSAVDVLA